MMEFRAAKCPECGGDLQVPPDRDVLKCMYCGKDIVVRQAIEQGQAKSVENWLRLADAAAEAENQEEAYRYFTKVLEVDTGNSRAWFGKAVAAGWSSNLSQNRYTEFIKGIQKAIACAAPEAMKDLREEGAEAANDITLAYFSLSEEHTREYAAIDGTWSEHVQRCFDMLATLPVANVLDPTNKQVLRTGIQIAKSIIEGMAYEDPYDTDDNGRARHKTHELSDQAEEEAQAVLKRFVGNMQALDPTYQAPTINKVGMSVATGCFLAFLGLGALGLVVWWIIKTLSGGN